MIQEIGIVIDLSRGRFVNTIYKDNKLQLTPLAVDANGNEVYNNTGYWESEPIIINDKIKAFKNFVKTVSVTGGAKYNAYTRTSDDGISWSAYELVSQSGDIYSTPLKYAMIKIEIIPENSDAFFVMDDFSDLTNEFMEKTQDGLKFKKKYFYELEKKSSLGEGVVFSNVIPRSVFKKIDNLSLET